MKKCHVTQRLAVKTSSIAIAEFHQDKRHTFLHVPKTFESLFFDEEKANNRLKNKGKIDTLVYMYLTTHII